MLIAMLLLIIIIHFTIDKVRVFTKTQAQCTNTQFSIGDHLALTQSDIVHNKYENYCVSDSLNYVKCTSDYSFAIFIAFGGNGRKESGIAKSETKLPRYCFTFFPL